MSVRSKILEVSKDEGTVSDRNPCVNNVEHGSNIDEEFLSIFSLSELPVYQMDLVYEGWKMAMNKNNN